MDSTRFEVDIHRHFDAPCELVYRAFIDEDQLASWFGPSGVLVLRETVSVDAKPGGHRRLTMITDSGSMKWSVETTFTEVVENQRLAGYETVTGLPSLERDRFTLSQDFVVEGNGTRVELRQGFDSAEGRVPVREFWLQSFPKLDVLLAG